MGYEIKSWFEQKGFISNPFSLGPLSVTEVATKAFVGREEVKEDIRKFVQENTGAIIVISEIGYGKSTIMNLAEKYACDMGKIVLRLDPRFSEGSKDKVLFFKFLVDEMLSKFSLKGGISETEKQILIRFKENGQKQDIPTFINTIRMIFERHPSVLIMDDLDKLLDFRNHVYFIKEVIDLLPKNLQVVTTGDINQIMNSRLIVSLLYQIFDFPIVLKEIDDIEKLKNFVYGRMEAYAMGKNNIIFDDKLFSLLLDRTKGNLRETFRYLSELLKKEEYNVEELIKTIIKVDSIRIHSLDAFDKDVLSILAGKKKAILEIKTELAEAGKRLNLSRIRLRLDDLHQNCLIFKEKARESRKVIYEAPEVIKYMIE